MDIQIKTSRVQCVQRGEGDIFGSHQWGKKTKWGLDVKESVSDCFLFSSEPWKILKVTKFEKLKKVTL